MKTTNPVLLLAAAFALMPCHHAQAQNQIKSCTLQPPLLAPSPALTAYAAGDFSTAESLFAAQPATPSTLAGLAAAQLQQSKLVEAKATAQKATTSFPGSATAFALLGSTLLREGEITDAATPISRALALDPCSARALFALATYNQLIAKRASAAVQLTSAHKLSPQDPEIAAAQALTLPAPAQASALEALLASSPALPPYEISRLKTAQAVAAANLTCTSTWPDKPVVAPLGGVMARGTHARNYGIKMRVGSTEISNIEFDTGVDGIVLNPHDAKAAGVKPIPGEPTAPNGTYYASVDLIRLGPAEFHNCPVRVATNETLGSANSLIGSNFFRDRLIHLDYIDRTVTFTAHATPAAGPLPSSQDHTVPPAEKDWSPAFFSGADILLPTLINGKGPYLMLLDTGSFISVYAPLIGGAHLLGYKEVQYPVRGSSGDFVKLVPQFEGGDSDHALVYNPEGKLLAVEIPAKSPDLRFYGNSRLDNKAISLDITPKSREAGVEISGLLGFSALQDFTLDIDYRNGLIHPVYDTLHRYAEREVAQDR